MPIDEKQFFITILTENFELFCKIIEELPEDKLSRDEFVDLISSIDSTMICKLIKITGIDGALLFKYSKNGGTTKLLRTIYNYILVAEVRKAMNKEGGKDDI